MTPKEEVEETIAIKRRESTLPVHKTQGHSQTEIKLKAMPPANEEL